MKKVLGRSLLHCRELETVATEVEKLVNSRPPMHVGGDDEPSECPTFSLKTTCGAHVWSPAGLLFAESSSLVGTVHRDCHASWRVTNKCALRD